MLTRHEADHLQTIQNIARSRRWNRIGAAAWGIATAIGAVGAVSSSVEVIGPRPVDIGLAIFWGAEAVVSGVLARRRTRQIEDLTGPDRCSASGYRSDCELSSRLS